MEKREELYAGKAKSVYRTDNPERFVLVFRDDTSAFDGEKKEQLNRKGMVNNKFNAFIMEKLEAAGVPTHFEGLLSSTESLVKKLDMIPVECVVRNVSAGSLCRRLGVAEGQELNPPTYELFLKNDALHDPMVNESLAVSFGWAAADELDQMKALTYRVNDVLKALFDQAGMLLVDYKLEFGRSEGKIVLGDEFSPDGCRIWDKETRKKMDKDRFRQGLGEVIETYEEVGRRLGIQFD
ncbi:phosphoribosylaminoimidazolesuccinocarboxamide synthase [uncultured Marinobacter sp.]|uniref:phosphoribosylaminoimidazolesuccinocarboxamide synthase n=1 Tax=uncultured Marinobacter sp. TaxID=187379 RepID=UPI00258E4010|nr:phosphoribosylaminoimidazolesuccinocarboxamide synthase [uncultured Marinobacter sp.]